MSVDEPLLSRLVDALERSRAGAATRPVSVTLPAPLAEAFRLLADVGIIDSVSVAASRALEDVLQSVVIGMRVDQITDGHPEQTPRDDEIRSLADDLDARSS